MAQSALTRLLTLVTWLAMGYSAIEPGAITPNQVGTCDPADCSSTCQCDPSGRTGDCICSWDVWFFVLVLGVIVVLSGTIRCIVSLCRRRDYVAVISWLNYCNKFDKLIDWYRDLRIWLVGTWEKVFSDNSFYKRFVLCSSFTINGIQCMPTWTVWRQRHVAESLNSAYRHTVQVTHYDDMWS